MYEIEELIKEEKDLLDKLSQNRSLQEGYNTILFCQKYGIRIGDTISFKERNKLVIGVIDHFKYSGVTVSYPIVRLFNQDGKVGKREARCWYSSLETIKVIPNTTNL